MEDPITVVLHLGLGDTLDRLADLQNQKRNLEKEYDQLHKALQTTLRSNNINLYYAGTSKNGHTATLYSQERKEVDYDLLRSLLSPDDYDKVVKVKTTLGMRIR